MKFILYHTTKYKNPTRWVHGNNSSPIYKEKLWIRDLQKWVFFWENKLNCRGACIILKWVRVSLNREKEFECRKNESGLWRLVDETGAGWAVDRMLFIIFLLHDVVAPVSHSYICVYNYVLLASDAVNASLKRILGFSINKCSICKYFIPINIQNDEVDNLILRLSIPSCMYEHTRP